MAILQALLALVLQSLGRVFNMAMGWATIMLFGRVPESRQYVLSGMAFASLIWLIAAIGIAFPQVAAFLLAFVRLPPWVDPGWVRVAMLAAAVVLPPLVGAGSLLLVEPPERPRGAGPVAAAVLRGYRYTVGMGLTLLLLLVVAPIVRAAGVVRRWTSRHVPVMIRTEDYVEVFEDVRRGLDGSGVVAAERPPGWGLRLASRILAAFVTGSGLNLGERHIRRLGARDLDILVYPFSVSISGKRHPVARAQAVIAEVLALSKAYLTWSRAARDMEDRIRHIAERLARGSEVGAEEPAIAAVRRDLRTLALSYEEWEVLARETLMVEREMLERRLTRAAGDRRPKTELATSPKDASGSGGASLRSPTNRT